MEVEKKIIFCSPDDSTNSLNRKEDDEGQVQLPGFRFHPTDEELVAFYLRRKVEKRPTSIKLIKQIDIYKYDPWDLPSMSYFMEVWTLCRILKRNMSARKSAPDWREVVAKRNNQVLDASSKTCSVESENRQGYISFRAPAKSALGISETNQLLRDHQLISTSTIQAPSDTPAMSYSSCFSSPEVNEYFLKHGDWDELRSLVEFAADIPFFT
ncbi:hypothetical protein RJ639_000862 [Escallonia herrerae]|uniref:NAC domain-containing protein n=1 Tax=Escallonia herrerae TaxID=1293975 RepID=A0AA88XHT0_9ASTE|nr:hypothetical protein RJ639_000862 [Escallonia herrerae]